MSLVTYTYTLTNGTTADASKVMQDFTDVKGAVDVLSAAAGVSDGVPRRGKSIVASTESRTNVAYGLMPTPDRVQNVVLPADGLIAVAYQAVWQESVAGAARATIFLGANQLLLQDIDAAGPAFLATQASIGGTPARDVPLTTAPFGLVSSPTGVGLTPDVTTGQAIGLARTGSVPYGGGLCYIFAAAGTYDVSVQFKASSGSVTAKDRKLWVWTIGF